MATVIVIGAGLGGLPTAMLLALDGHDVTVLERDPSEPPTDDARTWEDWNRPGVNQFRLLHFMLARWRAVIEQELPEIARELDERGAIRFNPIRVMPRALTGGWRPGDERYESLTARRPILEAAVAAAAARTSGVRVRRGVAVAGLVTGDPSADGTPHVVGVRTDDGQDLRADLVIDCGGRRSRLPAWLAKIGARPPLEAIEDSGFVYYGRHFRSPDGSVPDVRAPLLQPYDSVSILTLPADNGTWGVGFGTSSRDRALSPLRDPDRWSAALARYPMAAPWLEGEPLGDVAVMAKLEDRHRRLVVDGAPVATGILAVADAWACTNPSLGRGASFGLLHGCLLRDVLREVTPTEAHKLAVRFDEETEATLGPWYRTTLQFDRHRLAEMEAQRAGIPYEPDDPMWGTTNAFRRSARRDPDVLRGFLEVVNVLGLPTEVAAAPGRLERILELEADGGNAELPGPDRAELLAVLGA